MHAMEDYRSIVYRVLLTKNWFYEICGIFTFYYHLDICWRHPSSVDQLLLESSRVEF